MSEIKTPFEVLNGINCNEHTEKKNGLTYLSWAWAWGILKKHYPDSYYTVYESNGIPYFTDGRTCWVKTGVTVVDTDGTELEHIEYLPVMDFKNRSIPVEQITSMDMNKAIQRSLTKAAARHGLGLYIYAGEDLPTDEAEEEAAKQKAASEQRAKDRQQNAAPAKVNVTTRVGMSKGERIEMLNATMKQLNCNQEDFATMRKALIDGGIVADKSSNDMTDDEYKAFLSAMIQNYAA